MPEERSIKLINGNMMPLLGLGCWQSPVDEVSAAVEAALECGYRHIDTAYNYLNEEGVGEGLHNWLKKSKAKRSEVFVVSKLPMIGMYEGGVKNYLVKSLEKLKLDYLDLYLIHCPIGMKGSHDRDTFPKDSDGRFIVDYATDLIAVWKEMEKMVDLGLVKSIGISNFSMKQIRKICAVARIPPSVHQVEMHVEFQQDEMHKFCEANNIIMTAYAPLGSPGRPATSKSVPELLKNPVVKLVADNHKVTTAQVLVRYWIQRGVTVIPKSVNKQRIVTNGDVWSFKLSDVEIDALLTLDKGEEGRSFDFLSVLTGFSDHPECPL
ncbi:unnamed protein product [Meganyctiphanes norvegica]|uniref:NADP-dependent oxidoreductase domain-containing protein n=1 Tax=Meganyctiphanes norvegica TaxID=48144 RepID=A0AAV2PMH0_MEGNR